MTTPGFKGEKGKLKEQGSVSKKEPLKRAGIGAAWALHFNLQREKGIKKERGGPKGPRLSTQNIEREGRGDDSK